MQGFYTRRTLQQRKTRTEIDALSGNEANSSHQGTGTGTEINRNCGNEP